jgi:hypothetical protein
MAGVRTYIAGGQVAAAEIVFEDAPHDIEETASSWPPSRDHVKPRLIISHDGMHFNLVVNMRQAYRRTFGLPPRTLISRAGGIAVLLIRCCDK